jgi:hypothetical protein
METKKEKLTNEELKLLVPILLNNILKCKIHIKDRPNLKLFQSILYKLTEENR